MKLKFLIRELPRIDSEIQPDGFKLCLYLGDDKYLIDAIGKEQLAYVRITSSHYNNGTLDDETWIIYKVKKL